MNTSWERRKEEEKNNRKDEDNRTIYKEE